MSEDKDLLDKIAKISGQINLHKSQRPSSSDHTSVVPSSGSTWNRYPHRSTQYHRGRARGVPVGHRNRSLVLKSKPGSKEKEDEGDSSSSAQRDGFVSKHDRHMQLINTSVYDKKTQQRKKAIEETLLKRAELHDQQERRKIRRHFQRSLPAAGPGTATSTPHEIIIDGLRFHVLNGGSKLARVRGHLDSSSFTPKQTEIGGVKFIRSKNGNLYRSGIAKAKKKTGTAHKRSELCKRFTLTGQCPKGPLCAFTHDPSKVAICKSYLQTGDCPSGDACDLSHEPTPERVPACVHFLRGNCSKPACRYAHVRVNPSAPVCRTFAHLGYCRKGAECTHRHIFECPDYANSGVCRNAKCHLPHVDRAGQIKKHNITNNTGPVLPPADQEAVDDYDLVSDEEEDSGDDEDVDSDGMEMIMDISDDAASHAISEQQDYVRF